MTKDRAISINAVIATIYDSSGNFKNDFDQGFFADKIRALPPVTPQRPKGHFIYEPRQRLINETDDGCEYIIDYWCKCSECGGDFGFIKMDDAFCKFCGADMRGDDNEQATD